MKKITLFLLFILQSGCDLNDSTYELSCDVKPDLVVNFAQLFDSQRQPINTAVRSNNMYTQSFVLKNRRDAKNIAGVSKASVRIYYVEESGQRKIVDSKIFDIPILEIGEEHAVSFNIAFNKNGQYLQEFIADYTSNVNESNETNNTFNYNTLVSNVFLESTK